VKKGFWASLVMAVVVSILVTGCIKGRSLGDEEKFLSLVKEQVHTLEITTNQKYMIKNLGSYTVYKGFIPYEFYFATVVPVNRPTEEVYVYEKRKGSGSTKRTVVTTSLGEDEQKYLMEWEDKKIIKTFSSSW